MSRALVVHYQSAERPSGASVCRTAVVVSEGENGEGRTLAVFFPDAMAYLNDVPYASDPVEPAGGTWHFRDWCPNEGKNAPARRDLNESSGAQSEAVTSWVPARVALTDDLTVVGRGIGLGRPGAGSAAELVQAARSATADDPVWLMDGENPVAVIIPAEEYHPPGTCCCKNCTWGGDHGMPEDGGT